jgi:hypothetical protein
MLAQVGPPQKRLAQQIRNEKSRAIVVTLSNEQWEEVMNYLDYVSNQPHPPYKETAEYYMQSFGLLPGVLV